MDLAFIKQTRINFTKLVNSLSLEQLNKIPTGYKNNIVWNYAHNIITQQLLCYKLAGVQPRVDAELIEMYKKGTVPTRDITQLELNELVELSNNLLEVFEDDLEARDFSGYNSYTTSYNVTLNNIQEAVIFNAIHEGLHFGYAMAQCKLV